MRPSALRASPTDVLPWRALFLHELHAQCRYDACHRRGWADAWLLHLDDRPVGYAAVKGLDALTARDALFEWYVAPPCRDHVIPLATALVAASSVTAVECQTNDPCLFPVAQALAPARRPTTVLFEAPGTPQPRRSTDRHLRLRGDDPSFPHTFEPVGDHVLDIDGDIVGTGGWLTHYNPPFADIYMEVAPAHRRKGYGTRLVAGLIEACWLAGHIPAARCSIDHVASRATLRAAGMREVGQVVVGTIDT